MKFRRRRGFSIWLLTAVVLLAMANFLMAGEKATHVDAKEKYSQVRIYISNADELNRLAEAGLVFDHPVFNDNAPEVVLNGWEMDVLRKTNLDFEFVIDDLNAEYNKRAVLNKAELRALQSELHAETNAPANFEFGSMGGYYTFNEIVAELDQMVSLYPNLITAKQSIGTTIEGRNIWVVKISDNPTVDEAEEEVLFTSIMHAREPQGMATVIYFMWYVLENYGSDDVVDFLVNNREMYFAPCLNPDGYVYNQTTNPNGGGNWRKNRRNNGGGVFGVDLNRNYAYEWGFDNSGSSPNPSSGTYRGTAPASEPETQAAQNFAISRNFTMCFNYHSVAGSFNFSWGYLPNFFTPDHQQYIAFSDQMNTFNGWRFGTPWSNLGYVTNGYSNDWHYGEQTLKGKTFSWTVEEGGGSFWPNQSQIVPLAESSIYQNFVLANGVSGGMPSIVDITATPPSDPVIIPASGAFFNFDIALTNNTNKDWTVDYWNGVVLPIGEEIGPQVGPFSVTIPAGGTFNTTLTMEVPSKPPPANYGFNMKVGVFPNDVLATDSFSFTKTPGPTTTGLDAGEAWANFTPDMFAQSGSKNREQLTAEIPEGFGLGQNYPNPFNPSTTIEYDLPEATNLKIVLYDLKGREIIELVNGHQPSGSHAITWNGKDAAGKQVASGIYLYRMEAGAFVHSKKLILTK